MRGEEADGVVAPVVGQAARGQIPGGDELVDRQQLDRGHPEAGQVLDHRRARQPRVRSPQLRRHVTAGLGEPLDVQLVDDRVAVGCAGPPVRAPRERRVGHQRPRHRRRGIEVAPPVRVTGRVAEQALPPHQPARRSPWHTGRAAASPGCSAAPAPGHTVRSPGSRTAGRCRFRARTHARRRHRVPAAADAFPRRPSSNRHSTTRSAISDATAKLVPASPGVAPRGNGRPGQMSIAISRTSRAATATPRRTLRADSRDARHNPRQQAAQRSSSRRRCLGLQAGRAPTAAALSSRYSRP